MARSNLLLSTGLILVFAVAFLAVGAAFFMQVHRYQRLAHALYAYIPVFLMLAAGICSLCTSLLCLFTKLLRNEMLLSATVMFLALATVLSLNCSGFAGVYLYKAGLAVNISLLADISRYDPQHAERSNELVAFQHKFSCCGVHAPSDWTQSPYFRNDSANRNSSVPESCLSRTGAIFPDGCYGPVLHYFSTRLGAQIALAALVGVVLLAELLYLINRMSRRSQRRYRLLLNTEHEVE